MSARSNSDASSNASSPTSSINVPANNPVINNNNNNNPPKYGTLVPNRVFVGGIPSNTTEPELCQAFSKYGNVKATKIIADRAGVSKGYGFVTFETEEEAKRLQAEAENITIRERRLNIAPAIKKQPLNFRTFESAASPPPATPSLYYHNGMPYTFHNGMAYFTQTNQGAATMPTPELPVYQGSGYGPQSNAQSYPMMIPCNPNPTMYISSPQTYSPYPHMPVTTQGPPPLIYTAGPNPSTNQGTNTAENTQTVPMTAGPPTQYYVQSAMAQPPEMYYQPPSQNCYTPVLTLAPHEGMLHFCDVPIDQASNVSAEMPQVFQQRTFPTPFYSPFNTMHQQAPPPHPQSMPPLPPPQPQPLLQSRRYGNAAKKSTANNVHANASRKMKTVEGMDSGAAGDGPLARPVSPAANKPNTSTAADIASSMQSLAL